MRIPVRLEPYRALYIEGINGFDPQEGGIVVSSREYRGGGTGTALPLDHMSGDTTIEQTIGSMWELRQRVWDPDRKLMDILVDTGQYAFINKNVRFDGGYTESFKTMFLGHIAKITPEFAPDGDTYVTIIARDNGIQLAKNKRKHTYGAPRVKDPTGLDKAGDVILSKLPQDNRDWAVEIVEKNGSITLREIVENIVTSYPGYVIEYKGPEDMSFGGENHTELVQLNETDWAFLNRVASKKNVKCILFFDPENQNKLYFISKDKVQDQDRRNTDLSFVYAGRNYPSPEEVDPTVRKTELPIIGAPSFSIDQNQQLIGIPQSVKDPETGKDIIQVITPDGVVLETYQLRDDITPEERDKYVSDFDAEKTSWDEVKHLWIVEKTEQNPGEDEKSAGLEGVKRRITLGWKLGLTVFGTLFVGVGMVYRVKNVEPYAGEWACVKVTHTVGSDFMTSMDLTKDS